MNEQGVSKNISPTINIKPSFWIKKLLKTKTLIIIKEPISKHQKIRQNKASVILTSLTLTLLISRVILTIKMLLEARSIVWCSKTYWTTQSIYRTNIFTSKTKQVRFSNCKSKNLTCEKTYFHMSMMNWILVLTEFRRATYKETQLLFSKLPKEVNDQILRSSKTNLWKTASDPDLTTQLPFKTNLKNENLLKKDPLV